MFIFDIIGGLVSQAIHLVLMFIVLCGIAWVLDGRGNGGKKP